MSETLEIFKITLIDGGYGINKDTHIFSNKQPVYKQLGLGI